MAQGSAVPRSAVSDTIQMDRRAPSAVTLIARTVAEQGRICFAVLPEDEIVEVGRAPSCALSMPHEPTLSRHHARLLYDGDALLVEDLGSTNGTRVAGLAIAGWVRVPVGDIIMMGDVILRIEQVSVAELHKLTLATRKLNRADFDALTGLRNRRWLDNELERLAAQCHKGGRPFGLAMLDVDRFKCVNDELGHVVGDAVLRGVARTVLKSLRTSDHAVRYGGEEFLLLLPDTREQEATALAERVRLAISASDFGAQAAQVAHRRITVSIGVAEAPRGVPAHGIQAADRALYAAKRGGRDRVIAASRLIR